jgi:hypothetical protein
MPIQTDTDTHVQQSFQGSEFSINIFVTTTTVFLHQMFFDVPVNSSPVRFYTFQFIHRTCLWAAVTSVLVLINYIMHMKRNLK